MPRVRFTQNIQRHVTCPQQNVAGRSVRDVLEAYFQANGPARGYVLDDDGSLRHHMAIFIDGQPVRDRASLSDAVPDDGTIDVMQALSGG
jgi:molybdopterin synthase sulfur carrier subunit